MPTLDEPERVHHARQGAGIGDAGQGTGGGLFRSDGLPPGSDEVLATAPGFLAPKADYVGTPFEGALRTLSRRPDAGRFGVEGLLADSTLSTVMTGTTGAVVSRTGSHTQFRTFVRGARLLGADFRVHAQGDVYAITGRLVRDDDAVDPGPPRAWTTADVQRRVREVFELPDGFNVDVESIVLPGVRMWAYRAAFLVRAPQPHDIRVLLANDSLDPLAVFTVSRNASAVAYEANPLRGAKRTFPLSPVAGPPYELKDALADVVPSRGTRLRAADSDFNIPETPGTSANSAFDEVQTFAHIQRGLSFFARLVPPAIMAAPILRPMKAVVRDLRSPDNAWFVPTTGELNLGDYDGLRPSARSADVVLHELTHAITHLTCEWTESQSHHVQALNEGFSDYFACATLESPIMLDYVTNTPDGDRNCDRAGLRFRAGFRGEAHAVGEVWANVLWSIRREIGPAADHIAAESLQFFDGSSTFEAAPTYLLGADAKLNPVPGNGGTNAALIQREWEARQPLP